MFHFFIKQKFSSSAVIPDLVSSN